MYICTLHGEYRKKVPTMNGEYGHDDVHPINDWGVWTTHLNAFCQPLGHVRRELVSNHGTLFESQKH